MKLFDLGLSVVQEVREGSIDQKYEVRFDPLPVNLFSALPLSIYLCRHASFSYNVEVLLYLQINIFPRGVLLLMFYFYVLSQRETETAAGICE